MGYSKCVRNAKVYRQKGFDMNVRCLLIVFALLLFSNYSVSTVLGESKIENDSEETPTECSPSVAATDREGEEEDRQAEEKILADPNDAEGTAALVAAAQEVEDAYRSGDIAKIRQVMTETARNTLGEHLGEVPPEDLRGYAEAFKTRRIYVKSGNYAEISFWDENGKRFTSAFARTGAKSWAQMR